MPSARETRRAGFFEVPSSRAGVVYNAEVDLKASPGAAPASVARGCGCVDHVRSGPICKHAGAV
eukprot:8449785-Alexandrium_andersonii.AAC.1